MAAAGLTCKTGATCIFGTQLIGGRWRGQSPCRSSPSSPISAPSSSVWLFPLSCYLALSAGVIAHNHNHCPTFKNRKLNGVFGIWLSIFYGYPTFAWVPTHNLNHHKFVNKAGDATITWRYTNKHNALVAATYFFVSSYYQSEPIKALHPQGEGAEPGAVPADHPAVRRLGRHAPRVALAGPCAARLAGGLPGVEHDVPHPGAVRAVDHHVLQLRPARAHRPLERARPLPQLHRAGPQLPALQQRAPRGAPRDGRARTGAPCASCTGSWRRSSTRD